MNLQTVPQIARAHGLTPRQVAFAIEKHQIAASLRCGIVRMFDSETVAKVIDALRDTGALPTPEPKSQLVGAP